MEKPNYKEWSVNFNGKTIRVTNWWSVEAGEAKGTADLYVDDVHLDKNTDLIANPKKAHFLDDLRLIMYDNYDHKIL